MGIRYVVKGGVRLRTLAIEKEPRKLSCMADMKKMVKCVVKESETTKEEIIRSFGLCRRYAK